MTMNQQPSCDAVQVACCREFNMKIFKSKDRKMRSSHWALVCCFLLAACGGGGGGGGESSGGNATTSNTPLVLTGVNYESVSQTVLEGTNSLSVFSSTTSTLLTGVALDTPPSWMPALVSQVKKIQSWSVGRTQVLNGVVTSQSENCEYGGSLNASVNDANNNEKADSGDSMSISFDNCAISRIERISGSMSIVINSYSEGNFNAADISMRLDNFKVVTGNSTAAAVGDMRLNINEDSSKTTYLISGNNLTTSTTVSGVTERSSLSGFSMSLTDSKTGIDQMTYRGTVAMSSFDNQYVVVSTISPWSLSNGATYPYAGQMLLSGQSGSKIRITAVSSASVKLELDASGDGVYEESKVVTWASLQ
jgi:hypothetical protein